MSRGKTKVIRKRVPIVPVLASRRISREEFEKMYPRKEVYTSAELALDMEYFNNKPIVFEVIGEVRDEQEDNN